MCLSFPLGEDADSSSSGDTDYEDKCPENYNLEADCDGNFPNTENDTFDTDCPDHGYYEYEEDICPEMYHMREQVEDPAVPTAHISSY